MLGCKGTIKKRHSVKL